jgi:transposase-like protein
MRFSEIAKMTEEEARARLEKIRWPNGATCVQCGSMDVIKVNNNASDGRKKRAGLYECKDCRKQFTVTVNTIFEGSRIPIKTWLMAFSLMCASKKGISAHQLHRMLGITYKTAWHMCHRVRYAMTKAPLKDMLKGKVESDETYIGGKLSNRRNNQRFNIIKTPVIALVERGGNVVTKVANVTATNLRETLTSNIDKDTTLYTDELPAYKNVGKKFKAHETVCHSKLEFTRSDAHVNTAESFFSLLKRGLHGSFHHVSPEHLQRYCNEFSFRWNARKIDDATRTILALHQIEGKRLMYKEPIKKKEEEKQRILYERDVFWAS